jgi:hypothetical protein
MRDFPLPFLLGSRVSISTFACKDFPFLRVASADPIGVQIPVLFLHLPSPNSSGPAEDLS